jgi:hypothetical protein
VSSHLLTYTRQPRSASLHENAARRVACSLGTRPRVTFGDGGQDEIRARSAVRCVSSDPRLAVCAAQDWFYGGLGETVRRVLSQEDWPQVNTMICKEAQGNPGTPGHMRGGLADLPGQAAPAPARSPGRTSCASLARKANTESNQTDTVSASRCGGFGRTRPWRGLRTRRCPCWSTTG